MTTLSPLERPVAAATGEGLRSAVYEGTVIHRRHGPGPGREFSYRVAMPLLDLSELDAVASLHPLWSCHRPAPLWFRRADFHGNPAVPLDRAVRDLVDARTGKRPAGPIALLAHIRTWGWVFNPISFYYCFNPAGTAVDMLLAEVENTPWHERHAYVVGPPGEHRFAKAMHVSPFLGMDSQYALQYVAPGERLSVRLDVLHGEDRTFTTTLVLRRRPMTSRAIGHLMWAYPGMTHRVSAGIYAQAARLSLRGAPFHPHPTRRGSR